MVLPLIKIASLVIKSASKPFAKQIKVQATKNPKFHAFVVRAAQGFHSLEGRWAITVGDRSKEPRPLNVNAAIDLGSEMASEGFLLAIAVGLLLLEYNRGAKKDKQKEEALRNKFANLELQVTNHRAEIDELRARLGVAEGKSNYGHGATQPPPPVSAAQIKV